MYGQLVKNDHHCLLFLLYLSRLAGNLKSRRTAIRDELWSHDEWISISMLLAIPFRYGTKLSRRSILSPIARTVGKVQYGSPRAASVTIGGDSRTVLTQLFAVTSMIRVNSGVCTCSLHFCRSMHNERRSACAPQLERAWPLPRCRASTAAETRMRVRDERSRELDDGMQLSRRIVWP
jgi:hypothetical protein